MKFVTRKVGMRRGGGTVEESVLRGLAWVAEKQSDESIHRGSIRVCDTF